MGIPLWAPTTSENTSKAKSRRTRAAVHRSRYTLHADYLTYPGSSSDSDSSDEDEDKPTSRSSSPSPDTTPRARASNGNNGGPELLTLTEFLQDSISTTRNNNENTNSSSTSSASADANNQSSRGRWSAQPPRPWSSVAALNTLRPYVTSAPARAPSPPPSAPDTEEFTTLLAYLRRLASLQDAMLRTLDETARRLRESSTSSLSSSSSSSTTSIEAARANLEARTTAAMNAITNLNLHEREARLRATVDLLARELSHISRRMVASDPARNRTLERDVDRLRERLMQQRQQSLNITEALVGGRSEGSSERAENTTTSATASSTNNNNNNTTTIPDTNPTTSSSVSVRNTSSEPQATSWEDLDVAASRFAYTATTTTTTTRPRRTASPAQIERNRERNQQRVRLLEMGRQQPGVPENVTSVIMANIRAGRGALEGLVNTDGGIRERGRDSSSSPTAATVASSPSSSRIENTAGTRSSNNPAAPDTSTTRNAPTVRLDSLGNPEDDDDTRLGDMGRGAPVVAVAAMTPEEFGSADGARRWRAREYGSAPGRPA